MSWELPSFKKDEVEKEVKAELSPPWIEHARKIYALFGSDPQINVVYDPQGPKIKLYVTDMAKAQALAELLPESKQFGGVTLSITVVPPNVETNPDFLAAAFKGNPAFKEVVHIGDVFSNPVNYVVLANRVVQYFNDDLGSVDGVHSTLYEDLARDIFEGNDGVMFCTETDQDSKIVWP